VLCAVCCVLLPLYIRMRCGADSGEGTNPVLPNR
jgi:hypothetical protein